MRRYEPNRIRNVALVGHHGSGKTTVAEALLHTAGAIPRRGRVEDGTTTCDHEPTEQNSGMSMSLALAPFEWRDHKINLLDCPGEADFIGAVHAALRVADLAVIVVSAADGVEPQTEAVWELAADYDVPRLVFINKLDRERTDHQRVVDELRQVFDAPFAPLEIPIGHDADFHGLVDVLTETAELYDNGQVQHGQPIPAELADVERALHDTVVEEIVAGDDELLERFLSDEVPTVAELEHALTTEMETAGEVPVLCGSALADVGIDRLADYLVEIGPPPTDRPATVLAGDDADPVTVEVAVDPDGPTAALVFQSVADNFGDLSLFRVLSGTVTPDVHLVNTRTGIEERLQRLFTVRGREHIDVPAVGAGDIGVAAKLSDTATGDVLAVGDHPVRVRPVTPPPAVAAVALVPRTRSDEDKVGPALARLCEEDPTLVVERSAAGQLLLRGLGDIQLSMAVERLRDRYSVDVDTEPLRVAYRETITSTAEAEGRHKKQSGGHGQFAVAVLRVEPLARGEGLRFESKVVGGAIGRGYWPAVQRGVEDAMAEGGVRGFPVVDVAVTLLDGKEHSVDSSEMAFKLAARLAFRDAMANADPVVLEPVSLVEVVVPSGHLGDVLGDLGGRRAHIDGTRPVAGDRQSVTAHVPESEMLHYAADLRSITGGRGRFAIVPDRYDVVPEQLVDRLIDSETSSAAPS